MSGAGQSGPSPVVRVNDHVLPNPWGVDLAQRASVLKIVSERLSLVRYVFLVQIEDGIATATQRASLEYADARVLPQFPVQITISHINRRDRRSASLEQAVGETTVRATDIRAIEPFDLLVKCVERRLKLHSPARDEPSALLYPNVCVWRNLSS